MFPHKVPGFKLKSHSLYMSITNMLVGILVFGQVVITSALPSISASSGTPDIPQLEAWNSSDEIYDDDDDYIGLMQKLVFGIIAFVIVLLAVCLVLCFCCPICIIAKMRQRRGVVIRNGTGATTTTNGNTVTVTMNRAAPLAATASPQVVAISNNLNSRNKPYPVQESVTVVPLLQPISSQYPPQMHQQMNIGYSSHVAGPPFPQNFELPPPYPGLARENDTANLPYNPYFAGEVESPSAPPPK